MNLRIQRILTMCALVLSSCVVPNAKNGTRAPSSASKWVDFYDKPFGYGLKYPQGELILKRSSRTVTQAKEFYKNWDGAQAPLLSHLELQTEKGKVRLTIDILDTKNFPQFTPKDYSWWMRPCGQEGFLKIVSRKRSAFHGYHTLIVASDTEEVPFSRTHFYCVNAPGRPTVISFPAENKSLAEKILSTFQYYQWPSRLPASHR